MTRTEPKYRRSLNDSQLLILKVLYKFRFATTALLYKRLNNRTEKSIYYRFQRLLDQEYIGRKYDGKYRIAGKPAVYYLLPKGIQALKDKTDLNRKSLNNMYKNQSVSDQFVNHCLEIFEIYVLLKSLYGKGLSFLSKSELSEYEYFPKRLPDAYLIVKGKDSEEEYMLDVYDNKMPFFVIRQRINSYIKHIDSGDWESPTDADYPTLLIVCENVSLERQIQKFTAKRLGFTDSILQVFTTTLKTLLDSGSQEDEIWTNVNESDKTLSLADF
jgi:hypothetical protein